MPWMLLPVLPLLTYYGRITDGVTIWPTYLLIPAAAWLARRFGIAGLVVTIIGAAAALLPIYQTDGGEFGGVPEVYVIAIWVGIAVTAVDPLRALIGSGYLFCSWFIFIPALALLPLSVGLGAHDFEDGARMSIYFNLRPLLLFALLLFGLAGLPSRIAITGLVAAAAAGIAVDHFELDQALSDALGTWTDPTAPWINHVSVHYRWDDLAALLTGLACFYAGRTLMNWRAGRSEGSGPWRWPYLAIAALTLLAVSGTIIGQLGSNPPATYDFLGLYGDYYALLIASFMAGFLRRHLGVAVTLGLLLALLAGGNAAAYLLERGSAVLAVEQPLLVITFGVLGLRLRDLVDRTTTTFKVARWMQYAVLVGGALLIMTSMSELLNLAQAVMVAIGAAVLGVAAQWLRGKLALADVHINGDGWLLLLVLLGATLFLALNFQPILATVTEALDDLDLPSGMIAAGTLVLLNVPVAVLAAGFAKCLPKAWQDIVTIRDWLGRR